MITYIFFVHVGVRTEYVSESLYNLSGSVAITQRIKIIAICKEIISVPICLLVFLYSIRKQSSFRNGTFTRCFSVGRY